MEKKMVDFKLYKRVKFMSKSCLGKRKYRDYGAAAKYAKKYDEQYGVKNRVYYCGICSCFHLTTKSETDEIHSKEK